MATSVQQPQIPQPSQEGGQEEHNNKQQQTWTDYGKQVYNEQYERWMPWIEDMYLRWFTKDNKASYATKGAFIFFIIFSPVPLPGKRKDLTYYRQTPSPRPKSRASSRSTSSKTACTTSRPASSARAGCSSPWATPSPRKGSTAPSGRARTRTAAT